jgi:hypothetical protein
MQIPSAETDNQRQALPVEVMKQDRRLTARRPGVAAVRFLGQSAFVKEDNGSAFALSFF